MRNGILVIIISTALCTLVLNVFFVSCSSEPYSWSDDIRLTVATNYSGYPNIALGDNNIYVVWDDGRGETAYDDYEIYFKKSENNGKTWSGDRRLSNAPHYSLHPKIAVNESHIHVIWTDDREGGYKIFYNRSEDGGETWFGEERITPATTSSSPGSSDIAVNRSCVHVVYLNLSSEDELCYINSTDNGISWNDVQILDTSNAYIDYPSVAVNGSNIHIIWYNQDPPSGIRYINSTDNGKTWSEIRTIVTNGGAKDIAVYENYVHIVYGITNAGIDYLYYIHSQNNGMTWGSEKELVSSTGNMFLPNIDVENYNITVAWQNDKDGNREIYYMNSSDNGGNWSDEIRLTYDPNQSISPDIVTNEKNVHLVWADERSVNFEVYYKHYPVPFPPTNLTIDIWQTNLTLNWTAPENSPSPVDHYLIYRVTDPDSFTFSDSEIIYNSSGTGNDLLTSWNDTTALLDEANNYYYVVRAIDAEGWNDTNTNIVGKYVIQMKSGWNMISLPLAQRNTSISKVLQTIDGNYDVIWIYDSKENRWRSSTTDLTNINRTMGLWIHMKSKCNLSVVGAVPELTDITLYKGWNLVGYPSLKTRNLSDALSGISWQTVWTYDVFDINDLWKVNNTSKPVGLNDLDEMKPGYGYWVYVSINDTWVRTRVGEDNKVVVWRVPGLEEKEDHQGLYEPIIENPIETKKEDSYKVDIAPARSIDNNEESEIDISLIPLVILFVLIFVEVKLLYKRKK